MDATTTTGKSRTAKPVAGIETLFAMPKFEMPTFGIPKMEVSEAFREIAEKNIAQAKDAYEKVKAAADDATGILEVTYATAAKGVAEYNHKVIEAARKNINATFDFAQQLFNVKSLSEMIELSTTQARKQFEILSEQTKELAALGQKAMTETAEPMKTGVEKAFKKAA